MSKDWLVNLCKRPLARNVLKRVGFPTPVPLRRAWNKELMEFRCSSVAAEGPWTSLLPAQVPQGSAVDSLLIDFTHCRSIEDVVRRFEEARDAMMKVQRCGHVLVVTADAKAGAALQSVHDGCIGFVKAAAKELAAKGITVNMVQVNPELLDSRPPPGTRRALRHTLDYFLTDKCAYVSGQTLNLSSRHLLDMPIESNGDDLTQHWQEAEQRVAVVTGAGRGIGHSIVSTLLSNGYDVLMVDLPQVLQASVEFDEPQAVCSKLPLDITEAQAGNKLREAIAAEFGKVDLLVHNAGITRDRSLKRMSRGEFEAVMNVNLGAIHRLDQCLLPSVHSGRRGGSRMPSLLDGADSASSAAKAQEEAPQEDVLRAGGSEVLMSSISGFGGAFGQANYSWSKAALISYAKNAAAPMARHGLRINAVAPGFIETEMTEKMPFMIREGARRMNAMAQGGLPADIAQAVLFLGHEDALAISGQTLRVCGCHMVGK